MPNFKREDLTPEQQQIFDFAFATGKQEFETFKGEHEKLKTDYQEAVKKLSSAEELAKLSQTERDEYLKKVREFEEKGLSESQKFEKRLTEEREAARKQLDELKRESEKWRERHNEQIIVRALTDAASELDAIYPAQVVELLRGNVELEITDADTDSPKFTPKVRGEDPKTKAAIKLDIRDGVKQYLDKFPNLVKSNIIAGKNGRIETITGADGKTQITEDQLNDPAWVNENWDKVIRPALKNGITVR